MTAPFERFYFASRYENHPLMREYRNRLYVKFPNQVHVTSRWIDQHNDTAPVSLDPDDANMTLCQEFAYKDLSDLENANTLVAFSVEGGGKGGRHIEFGYALALKKRIVLVGRRENVFHTHSQVEHFETFEDWVAAGIFG